MEFIYPSCDSLVYNVCILILYVSNLYFLMYKETSIMTYTPFKIGYDEYYEPYVESSGDKPFRVILWKKYIIQGFFETL